MARGSSSRGRPGMRGIACASFAVIGLALCTQAFASAGAGGMAILRGAAVSGGVGIAFTPVTLYRTSSPSGGPPVSLGTSVTRGDGAFAIAYRPAQARSQSVLYVVVGAGAAVRVAAVLGTPPVAHRVVADERTTVASGFALAQFISGRGIAGKSPGLQNAAAMTRDLVDVRSGGLSSVLRTRPNGSQTPTLRTFNSLANMLVPCARSALRCGALFRLATPPRGPAPLGTLAAVADIARNPWHNVGGLFALARAAPAPYRPALGPRGRPDAWILALRFYGDGRSMNGPGNMAIDARGNVWVTNNYTYSRDPRAPVCGGRILLELTPTGEYVRGSPYSGGGLNGSGFGITLDPRDHVWVGNFGFSSEACAPETPHVSVSEFTLRGRALSPDQTATSPGGFTRGGVFWPQGTVSDRAGNIWIANCGNDTVTRYAAGDPLRALALKGLGIQKPFDIAFNGRGQAFVTGNGNSTVAMLNPDGTPALRHPIRGGGLSAPLGIAADSKGNMWVANTGRVSITCPTGGLVRGSPSVTLIDSHGRARARPFTGGGVTEPWGIAVDGDDNVWVANFSGQRVAELCGIDPAHCPPGMRTGQQISPARTGYGFAGLTRNTGIQIDPSGNVWIADNWKIHPIPSANPGGYDMVVYIGVAGPIRTPLIGPPRPL